MSNCEYCGASDHSSLSCLHQMTTDKKSQDGSREWWLHVDENYDLSEENWFQIVQVSRRNMWEEDKGQTIHLIEHSAYLALQKELEAAKTEIATYHSGSRALNLQLADTQKELADARRQIEMLQKF